MDTANNKILCSHANLFYLKTSGYNMKEKLALTEAVEFPYCLVSVNQFE